jgi:carbon-monoxide dehydrogenase small subunit
MKVINLVVNGTAVTEGVDDQLTLADLLRDKLHLTGTHLGCEHGVCGACTVLVDDEPIRSCITLAAATDGREVRTIEGFGDDPRMEVIRQCFSEAHGLQCGFCTPGMVLTVRDMIARQCCATPAQIRLELAGNICRCTGYGGIVKATEMARDRIGAAAQGAAQTTPATVGQPEKMSE